MIRLMFRCIDHDTRWGAIFASKAEAFRQLAEMTEQLTEQGVPPCTGIVIGMQEVVPDDLTPEELESIVKPRELDG